MGLGVALEHAVPCGYWLPAVCVAAVPLLVAASARLLCCPDILYQEIRHPVLGSMPVAGSMALMLFSVVFRSALPPVAAVLWCAGMLISLAAPVVFFFFQLKERKKENLLPSWFLSLGGLLIGAMTVPYPSWERPAVGIMTVGSLLMLCLFPPVLWRILISPPLPAPLKPVCAIAAAPINLMIVSWLTTHPDFPVWGWLFVAAAVGLNLWIYAMLPSLLRLPFSPAQAALTFPMAVTATAMFKLSAHFPVLKAVAAAELCIAVLVIAHVCWRFAVYGLSAGKRG